MPRPQFVTCPLCRQGFGHASVNIHIPQCYEKALKRWKLTRDGPRPVMPPLVDVDSLPSSRRTSLSPSRAAQPAGSSVAAARSIKRNSVVAEAGLAHPVNNGVLKSCSKCGRTFSVDRIAYHESVCIAGEHRPSFDSRQQRAVSVDEAMGGMYAVPRPNKKKQRRGGSMGGYTNESDPSRVPQTNWREAHEELITVIREARRQSVGNGGRGPGYPQPQTTVSAPRRPAPRNDNADKVLMGGPSSGTTKPTPPLKKATVPPSMARYNQTLKEKQQQPRRTSAVEVLGEGRRRSINEVVNYATGGSKSSGAGGVVDGPRYIVNDNTSSIGMLQAFGQA